MNTNRSILKRLSFPRRREPMVPNGAKTLDPRLCEDDEKV